MNINFVIDHNPQLGKEYILTALEEQKHEDGYKRDGWNGGPGLLSRQTIILRGVESGAIWMVHFCMHACMLILENQLII